MFRWWCLCGLMQMLDLESHGLWFHDMLSTLLSLDYFCLILMLRLPHPLDYFSVVPLIQSFHPLLFPYCPGAILRYQLRSALRTSCCRFDEYLQTSKPSAFCMSPSIPMQFPCSFFTLSAFSPTL